MLQPLPFKFYFILLFTGVLDPICNCLLIFTGTGTGSCFCCLKNKIWPTSLFRVQKKNPEIILLGMKKDGFNFKIKNRAKKSTIWTALNTYVH
jgi:hypothetical protein